MLRVALVRGQNRSFLPLSPYRKTDFDSHPWMYMPLWEIRSQVVPRTLLEQINENRHIAKGKKKVFILINITPFHSGTPRGPKKDLPTSWL